MAAMFTAETTTRQRSTSAASEQRSSDDFCSSPAVIRSTRSVSFARSSAARLTDVHRASRGVVSAKSMAGAIKGPANTKERTEILIVCPHTRSASIVRRRRSIRVHAPVAFLDPRRCTSATHRLYAPAKIRRCVENAASRKGRRRLRTRPWCRSATSAPVYPSPRRSRWRRQARSAARRAHRRPSASRSTARYRPRPSASRSPSGSCSR